MADINTKKHTMLKLQKCAKALSANNMETFIASTKEEAREIAKTLLADCTTVTMGGSMSAFECGIPEMLSEGDFIFYNRNRDGITPDEVQEIYRKAFTCDAYISSSNAITQNGERYNVDGNSNRVAAMLFGSKKLIVIAGCNKIVKDIDEAIARVRQSAAPANCLRLGLDNYCTHTGNCMACENSNADMASGCNADSRICCNYVVMAHQRQKDRVKVILVAEELGY